MKSQNVVWKKILKASLAAAFTVAPLVAGVSISQAAPANGYRNNDREPNDRNNYQTFTGQVSNVKGQEFNLRVGGTTYNVYASTRLPNGINQNDSVRVYGQRYGVNDIRNATVQFSGNNNSWDNNRNTNNRNTNNRWNNNNSGNTYQTFTGIVNNVESNSKFDIRIGNQTYNVYPSGRVPGQISKNDRVRIYGQRYGANDIRNANVVILRNNGNNNNGNWNNNNSGNWNNNNNQGNTYQTFTGVVNNVESNSKFDIRIGNQTYNVYPSGRVPGQISKNDTVRIYGQRYGVNDIRNANVVIVRNGNSNNNNTLGNYQTYTGTVNSVESNSQFNVRIGSDTYNVYPSGNAARRVEKGNVVRIYGQRYGVNDIRNANVVIVRNR